MKLLVVIVLFGIGFALLPLENALRTDRLQMKYGGAHVTFQLREAIGQNLAIALLAGMRGIVADFLWIQGHGFWEKREWLRQYRNIEVAVTLQPQSIMFWDLGQWHMAWNIGYGAFSDPKNRTKAEAIKREREWHEKARQFILRGIENIPNRYELYFTMGWLYFEKLSKDCDDPPCSEAFCKSADYLAMATSYPDAPQFVPRLYARALEKCGDLKAAYEEWKRLWRLDHSTTEQAWSIIEREIRRLEDYLQIPNQQRVFPQPTP